MRPAVKDREYQRAISTTNVDDLSEAGEIVRCQRGFDSIPDCVRHGAVEQLTDLGPQLEVIVKRHAERLHRARTSASDGVQQCAPDRPQNFAVEENARL